MKPYYLSIALLLIGLCRLDPVLPNGLLAKKQLPVSNGEIREFFADSLHIGKKSHNKIELTLYHTDDTTYVVIKFYAKQNGKWQLRNKYEFEKDALTGCDPQLQDFNNDKLSDMTYHSAVAARGANDVRKLFIYDKVSDRLIYIKNSEEYPNLQYNRELKCIDAFMVYGGCMTAFLKLEGSRLRMFASVELSDGLTVREYNGKGVEKIIFTDPNNPAGYVRYKNYKPLKEWEE